MKASVPHRVLIDRSPVALAPHSGLQRLPRFPLRRRPEAFYEAFDGYQLFYDVFWHVDGQRILAVGPAPRNLQKIVSRTQAVALPSGKNLKIRLHSSLSVMIAEWSNVPDDTTSIEINIGNQNFSVKIRPNVSSIFSGRRILFTMNKNNDLNWIKYWAQWHVRFHGTDAIVIFDNGSDHYTHDQISQILTEVAGLKLFSVIPFAHKFGPIDPSVKMDPYWARFAQISSMSLLLRRFGMQATGLLNCDIDELANAPNGQSLYDMVKKTRHGLLILPGRWVEANRKIMNSNAVSHFDFAYTHKDKKKRDTSPVKWALDPSREWVKNLDVHPYWHWIHGRPAFSKSRIPDSFFWHFRGINTGWKFKDRLKPREPSSMLIEDQQLQASFKALDYDRPDGEKAHRDNNPV